MEKNENGFSDYKIGSRNGLNCRGERITTEDGVTGNSKLKDNIKATDDDTCSQKQLAMVYSPVQCFRLMYSPMDALNHGTLFEELYKPLEEQNG